MVWPFFTCQISSSLYVYQGVEIMLLLYIIILLFIYEFYFMNAKHSLCIGACQAKCGNTNLYQINQIAGINQIILSAFPHEFLMQ